MTKLLTAEDVADILGTSVDWVQRNAREGKIGGAKKLGIYWRFVPTVFERWLEEGVESGPSRNRPRAEQTAGGTAKGVES